MGGMHSGSDPSARARRGRAPDTGFTGEISQMIVSASADGIVVVDEAGIIRLCNAAAGEIFARPAAELVGTPFGFPIPGGQTTDIDILLPGGGIRVAEMRAATITVEWERLDVVTLRDVTSRQRVEQDLRVALDRQNVVVGVAAHELQNPLFAITVLLDVLRDPHGLLNEEQRTEVIDRITDRAAVLQALVRKLLTASRIDTTGGRATLQPVPVLELLLERLAEFIQNAPPVHVSCSPELVAMVDREEFSEMVNNYLENAFSHGRPPVDVQAVRQEDAVLIRVCDRGPGVPDAFVPHLFERFSRDAQDGVEGTGLGLWIVRALARANSGDAWYEPNPDGGACFCLRLPRAPSTVPG
jgi:signal transduction histidine kinase